MGLNIRNLEQGYEVWLETMPAASWFQINSIKATARSEGRFEQVTQFSYRFGRLHYDFESELADPDCFGQPKRIDEQWAFTYLLYLKLCRREDVQPTGFVDFRYYVKSDGPDPDSEFDVVDARDCA